MDTPGRNWERQKREGRGMGGPNVEEMNFDREKTCTLGFEIRGRIFPSPPEKFRGKKGRREDRRELPKKKRSQLGFQLFPPSPPPPRRSRPLFPIAETKAMGAPGHSKRKREG